MLHQGRSINEYYVSTDMAIPKLGLRPYFHRDKLAPAKELLGMFT